MSESRGAQKQAMRYADMVHIKHFHQVDMKLAMKPSSLEGRHETDHETSNETAFKHAISYSDCETDHETSAMKPAP